MTPIRLAHRLSFVSVTVRANGQSLTLQNVLLDTDSAGTAFRTDDLETIGVHPRLEDRLVDMRGIGGIETVVQTRVDGVEVGDLIASPMIIQLGELDYSIPMDGILGLDFLLQTGAQLDFKTMEIRKAQ